MLGESLNLCGHSVVELHVATQMLVMVDCVMKMTVKKSCKYGKYGSFEHLFVWFSKGWMERWRGEGEGVVVLLSYC